MQGWIKLHRELINKPIWQNSSPEQKTILITLLMMANHQEKEWEWMGEKYKARPGQFVTSLPSIVKKCGKGVSTQNVRTALARFKKYDFLTDKSTNKNRLITIINWELYQQDDCETNSQPNRQLTGNQQATNRQLTANKNDKNDKNVKKDIYSDYCSGNDELLKAFKDWEDMRNKIKKPLTDRAKNLSITQLEKITTDPAEQIKVINQSTLHCWQTFYEIKEDREVKNARDDSKESIYDYDKLFD